MGEKNIKNTEFQKKKKNTEFPLQQKSNNIKHMFKLRTVNV